MSGPLQILFSIFGVLFLAVGSHAKCCDTYADFKTAVKDCENETTIIKESSPPKFNELCHYITCIAEKWGTMENGKFVKEKEESILQNVFPEASDNLKSKILECSTRGNEEGSECKVVVKTYNCIFESTEHRQEIDKLLQKRENS